MAILNYFSDTNEVIVKILPKNSKITPVPRIRIPIDFYKEYDNSVKGDIAARWRDELNKFYPNWQDEVKTTTKILYIIKPEFLAHTSTLFYEPLIGNPSYYGYIIHTDQLVNSKMPYVEYKKMSDVFSKTGQRTFSPADLRQLDILGDLGGHYE